MNVSLVANAGRDVALRGATVVADSDVLMRAARNLTIGNAENTQEGSSSSSSKKSGGRDGPDGDGGADRQRAGRCEWRRHALCNCSLVRRRRWSRR
ncbi:hemagglutinin repeat-containing protein [Roseateles chitinivorans]|uniref:hemagglutinin repeat-containing protein n=1 Tax=Roseateles chitinivorans TaxID=2917965 RepID=UPI003D6689FE